MTRVLVLLLLSSGVAQAQIVRPMGETPGDLGPTVPTKPEESKPDVGAGQGRRRFSLLSAGRGGPLFAFSEVVDGLVVGGLIGAELASSPSNPLALPGGACLGALAGGIGLGGLGVLLQYLQPIGLVAAGASALGVTVGALAGLGVAALLEGFVMGLPGVLPGVLALVGSQVGAFVPFALLWSADDLDPAELALMTSTALYAFAITSLVNVALARPFSAPALLVAPAIGMAVGGLVAALTQLSTGAVFRYTALPLGVALATFFLGGLLGAAPQVAAIASLGGMGLTLLITGLVTFATTVPAKKDEVTVTPMITAIPAGPLGRDVVLGPGAVLRF